MISGSLLDLARLGDVHAIAESLNYIFLDMNISVKASLTNTLLEIILTRPDFAPDRTKSIEGIQKYIDILSTPIFGSVRIYSKRQGRDGLDWWHEITIRKTLPVVTYATATAIKTASTNSPSPLSQASRNLNSNVIASNIHPPSVIEFSNLDPKIIKSMKSAGGRGVQRLDYEAQQVYEKIPENIRRSPSEIHKYRNQHDWSHKQAHANGGSNHVSNGDWEAKSLNRARGSKDVTHKEEVAIQAAKAKINFQSGAKIVGGQMLKAGGIAFGVELAFSGLENFVAVQRGEKNIEEALLDTVTNSASVAVTTAVIVGGVLALTITFPIVGTALGVAAPFLQIVGVVGCMDRLLNILNSSPKVEGMERLQMMLASYGIDDTELSFRDLEMDDDLLQLKTKLGIT
jgi:hypothetical protein